MRLELQLDLEKPELSKDYRRIVLSYLKFALSECNDGKYFEKYFKDTIQKDYCFSVLMKGPKFSKDKILLEEPRIKILFSCDDRRKTGLILFSAFLGIKNRKFPLANNNAMVLKRIDQKSEKLITESTVYMQTVLGNGLCIREHDRETNRDRFITFEDEDFKEKASEILSIQAKSAGFSENKASGISLEPVQCKKVVVLHYGVYIDVTVGIIKMTGDPDVLQYLYSVGAGSKHSAGFGALNVLRQGESI